MTTPTRRALLLGADFPDLAGIANDVEFMREALEHHGFTHIRTERPATREKIVTSIRDLIDDTREGDVVIIYYSGHGSTLESKNHEPLGERALCRFLVASDFADSRVGDFRGYTNSELSLDLAVLTKKTKNVVVIMDCCHAGRIFRAEGEDEDEELKLQDSSRAPVRFLRTYGRWEKAAWAHYEQLEHERSKEEFEGRAAEANPWAVRLLASLPDGKAFEDEIRPREGEPRYAGRMTLALHRAMLAVDPQQTTWQDIGRMIRATPQGGGQQLVTIEGPHRRLLFSLTERGEIGEVDIDPSAGEVRLLGGSLADLGEGDEYELRAQHGHEQKILERARIRVAHSSYAELDTRTQPGDFENGGAARPTRYGRPRAAVRLVGFEPGTARELLEARLGTSGYLRILDEGEEDKDLPVVASLHFEDDKLRLCSGALRFDTPRTFTPVRAPRQASLLADHISQSTMRLARASTLRRLVNLSFGGDQPDHPPNPNALPKTWTLEWAKVEDGVFGSPLPMKLTPGPDEGITLSESTPFSVRLIPTNTVYLSILAVRADGNIRVLSRASAGGVQVGHEGYVLGQRSAEHPLRGESLRRPTSSVLRDNGPVSSTLVAVITDSPVDLRCWEQPGVARFVERDALKPESSKRAFPKRLRGVIGARYHVEAWTLSLQ